MVQFPRRGWFTSWWQRQSQDEASWWWVCEGQDQRKGESQTCLWQLFESDWMTVEWWLVIKTLEERL